MFLATWLIRDLPTTATDEELKKHIYSKLRSCTLNDPELREDIRRLVSDARKALKANRHLQMIVSGLISL